MTYCLPNCFLYPRTACIMKYRVVQKSYQCKSFISWPTATCPQATDLHQMSCRIVIHSSINGILNLKRLNFMEFFFNPISAETNTSRHCWWDYPGVHDKVYIYKWIGMESSKTSNYAKNLVLNCETISGDVHTTSHQGILIFKILRK